MQHFFSVAAVLFSWIGFAFYIRSILKTGKKPSWVSWVIWTSLDIIMLIGMLVEGAISGQIIGATIGACITVILALRYGDSGWSGMDFFCLVGAIAGIILWGTFRSPTMGIVTSAILIILGSIPTFMSVWKNPTREDSIAWTLWFVSCIAGVLAIPKWTLADVAPPIAFMLVESVMMILLFRPRKSGL